MNKHLYVAALLFAGTQIGFSAEGNLSDRYNQSIAPLLKEHCFDCHISDSAEGGFSLESIQIDPDKGNAAEHWSRVLEQLEIGTMPPVDEPQLTALQKQQVVNWIIAFLTASGRGDHFKSRLLLPEHGNRVSHKLLFSGDIQTMPFTPARLWRMSPHVYRGKRYQDNRSGGVEAEPVSYTSKATGIRDYASQEVMDESGFSRLKSALEDIITNQFTTNDTFKAIIQSAGPPEPELMNRVIENEYLRATGSEIGLDRKQLYLSFMRDNIKQAGKETGLKVTLLAIYLSTEAVYRLELGRGPADQYGRKMLSPPEVALAIAYAFGDDPPSKIPIIQAAIDADRLNNKAGIESVVRQMLKIGAPPYRQNMPAAFFARLVQSDETPGYGWYPRVIRFFDEFFQYSRSAGTFKDSPGKAIGSKALVARPQGYIAQIVNEDKDVFKELLTSSRFNQNKDAELKLLAKIYNARISGSPKSKHENIERWYEDGLKHARKLRSETFRAGILTSNSWLIAHSTNDENHPVLRGIWVRERLLAGVVPDLPINVDAQIPDSHEQTLRQRYNVTKAEQCWKCHKLFNPLGMPFESFDDRGWIRDASFFNVDKKEYLPLSEPTDTELAKLRKRSKIEARPLDATGQVSGTGEEGVDGPVQDANDLVHRLAKSTRVRQSIIRHAFRFWMGRNEMLSDSRTLIDADRAYTESGGKFSEVLVSLLTSDSFLYRK